MANKKSAGKSLVIVESPAKAKTINRYLGDDYVVKASMGHVRDLPERDFGIDIDSDFAPTYETLRGRAKVLRELRELAAKAPEVVLATDRDREGEAIAWHLSEALQLPAERVRRVIFNEITKSAISEAFKHPHQLDMDRVNAQQARRILDRIVGYELSPLLWKKIAKGLSAGRVQSVAVRLIVDREREIRAFVPEERWTIAAYLTGEVDGAARLRDQWKQLVAGDASQKQVLEWLSGHGAFRAELVKLAGKKFEPGTAEEARAVAEALGFECREIARKPWPEYARLGLTQAALIGALNPARTARLVVSDLTTKRTLSRAPAPFTTAALQQAAANALRFSASRTMRIAQSLYEGVDLHGEGPVGLITYMRTDSVNLSGEALSAVRALIGQEYGPQYVPESPNFFGKRQANAQEAHEAIRPTEPARTPESLRQSLNDDQFRLYDLIWRRFVACQMPPAEWDSTSVSVSCETALGTAQFSGNGRKLVFDGYMRVAGITSDDQILPPLEVNAPLGLLDLEPKQQFSSPPPRYTEASLIKALESEGIGRPSTYAAIIDTIQDRGYVDQVDRKFRPSALGELVTDKLVQHFPKIMDVKFTSHMEQELDKIEEAHLDWVSVLHEFYDPFHALLLAAREDMDAARAQPSEYKCPQCQSDMVYRWSKTGRFLSCSAYPKCKTTMNVDADGKPIVVDSSVRCELCDRPMTVRQARGSYFLGCTGYPECRGTRPCDETGKPLEQIAEEDYTRPCETCGEGTMRVKWKARRAYLACDAYPKCKATASIPAGVHIRKKPAPPPEDAGLPCDRCSRPMVIRDGKRGKFLACSGFPKCRNSKPVEKLEELRAAAAAAGLTIKPDAAGAAAARKAALSPGEPPPGFAMTRTGKPVVETLPEKDLHCPECGNPMELRRGRFGPFFSCTGFPKCRFVANLRGEAKKQADELMPAPARPKPRLTAVLCKECGAQMLLRAGKRGNFLGCSRYPQCRATQEVPRGTEVPLAEEPQPVG